MADGNYDEVLERLRGTGPEFRGWLSNHGPMAADALLRLGAQASVHTWVDTYLTRLEDAPDARWPIDVTAWRDPLGDASRLGDWLEFFDLRLRERPWQEVLSQWWPRLLPGAIASATHPLIRTGHAVRALGEAVTELRVAELGQALGYWAARWAPLPRTCPAGRLPPDRAIAGLPAVPDAGGARTRLAHLSEDATWPAAAARLRPVRDPADVPAALDYLVDTAVTYYADWAPAEPTMLVHMATAPRAARLAIDALPTELWSATYDQAWATSAAIAAMYRPTADQPMPRLPTPAGLTPHGAAEAATASSDAHAIKFAEVALESDRRNNPRALDAAYVAARLLAEP